jgi:hypothetical protein
VGFGDWIMATGQVRELYARHAKPVCIVGIDGKPQWNVVFENNPKICMRRLPGSPVLLNGPNARPYIASKTAQRWTWRKHQLYPGEIYLTAQEKQFGAPLAVGKVVIEPHVKGTGHGNKAWAWDRWQAVVDSGIASFVQCGPEGTKWLRGVECVVTPTFRHACAVLHRARAFVGTEGGLHHASAAMHVPAVVLFSEFIGPAFTGYKMHRNIAHATFSCGSRVPCASCAASMAAISVDEVVGNLREITS